jgi:hypothetical protein
MQLAIQIWNRCNRFITATIAKSYSHAHTETCRKAIEKYGI